MRGESWLAVIVLAVIALIAFFPAKLVEVEEAKPRELDPQQVVYKSQQRECVVDVYTDGKQRWICDDGCFYYGYWKVELEKHLDCTGIHEPELFPED